MLDWPTGLFQQKWEAPQNDDWYGLLGSWPKRLEVWAKMSITTDLKRNLLAVIRWSLEYLSFAKDCVVEVLRMGEVQ